MSLVEAELQPALAWSFESSNVDYITGLSPILSTAGTYAAQTGGTITTVSGKRIHTFTTVGTDSITFLVPVTIQLLVVAGGGGGGGASVTNVPGGGGGAGEVYSSTSYSVVPGTYTITVGAGGAGGIGATGTSSTQGSNSIFGSITANGGGRGGDRAGAGTAGGSGGSGGGGARNDVGGASSNTFPGQGNAGGDSSGSSGAGGGGAGGAGANQTNGNTSTSVGSAGGAGVSSSISGAPLTYGAGGSGGDRTNTANGGDGTNGRGNGGGGADSQSVIRNGGNGGSGVVVIAYTSALYPAPTYVAGKYNQAINFDNQTAGAGANSFVSYDVSSFNLTSNSATLSLWLNPSYTYPLSAGSNPYYISLQGTTYYSFQTETTLLSNISLDTGSSPNIIVGRAAQSGVWNHYCGVFSNVGTTGASNTASYFYLNGALIGSANTLSQSFTDLYLASQNGTQNGAWCSIDDVRVYNTALTAAQVQSVYNQQGVPGRAVLSPPSPQPSLMWQFESSNVDSVTKLAPFFSTIVSSTTFAPTYQAGKYNLGMQLMNTNGTSANTWVRYNFTNSIPADTGITLAAWVNHTSLTTNPTAAVTLYDSSTASFANTISLGMSTTTSNGYTNGAGTYSSHLTPNSVAGTNAAGTWYHLAVTFTSTSIIGYRNGVASTPKTTVATGLSFIGMRLGTYTNAFNNNSGSNPADCILDDVRVYNTALTAAQIQEIYASSGMPSRQVFTGAPLFNQLSPSAASSAVGAFSLRAVNGVTAKAVQIRRSSDSATQDFWADSLGNLLTAPVTGQLIQNWLGGATGYVTTWYDQTGLGNHATQATTANQPTITIAPSGSGFLPVFTSPAPNKYLSIPSSLNLGGINGSYTKSVWTYITSNVNQFQNFLATSTASSGQGIHIMGWNFPSASSVPYFSASQNTYSVNLTSAGILALNTWVHLAVTYNNPTQTFVMYRNGVQVYSNTSFTSSFNAGDGALATNFRIGVGFGNACNSQNYDVAIFNSALSASDITTLYNSRLY